MLRELKLAEVLREVLRLHPAEVKEQAFASGEPAMLAVPVAGLEERILIAPQLELVGVLRLLREPIRACV